MHAQGDVGILGGVFGGARDLGKAVDEEGQVGEPLTTFAPGDKVHAAVVAVGSSDGLTLSARWLAADGTEVAKAGQSLTVQAEVSGLYDMSAQGQYSIRYLLPTVAQEGKAAKAKQARAGTHLGCLGNEQGGFDTVRPSDQDPVVLTCGNHALNVGSGGKASDVRRRRSGDDSACLNRFLLRVHRLCGQTAICWHGK